MKKKLTIIISSLMIINMLFAVFVPAKAAPLAGTKKINFRIINRSEETVTVKLTGPENYVVTVLGHEKKKVQIVKGDYKLEYTSCGDSYDADLSLKKDFKMIIYACAIRPSKMRIKSHIASTIELKLKGPQKYKFNIKMGQSRLRIYSGWYKYSYKACNKTFSGKIHVAKSGKTELVMHSCEWFDRPNNEHGKVIRRTKFVVKNRSSLTIQMFLIGPSSYSFKIRPGKNAFSVLPGKYEYGYYLDNKLHSGIIKVKKSGSTSLILVPSKRFGSK